MMPSRSSDRGYPLETPALGGVRRRQKLSDLTTAAALDARSEGVFFIDEVHRLFVIDEDLNDDPLCRRESPLEHLDTRCSDRIPALCLSESNGAEHTLSQHAEEAALMLVMAQRFSSPAILDGVIEDGLQTLWRKREKQQRSRR